MQGVVARRNNFAEPILAIPRRRLRGVRRAHRPPLRPHQRVQDRRRRHGLRFARLGCGKHRGRRRLSARRRAASSVGSIHVNVIRPFPEAAIVDALKGKKNVIILERTDEALSGDNPLGRDIRTALSKAVAGQPQGLPAIALAEVPQHLRRQLRPRLARLPPRAHHRRIRVRHRRPRAQGRQDRRRRRQLHRPRHRPSLLGHRRRNAVAAARRRGRRALPLHRRMGRHHHRQKPRRNPRRPERPALSSATA